MAVWWSLLKKEFRMSRTQLVWNAAGLLMAGLIGFYFAYRYKNGIVSINSLVVLFLHFGYLAAYMISSLSRERRTAPLWMQTPHPAWKMLSAKLTAGLGSLIVSLLIVYGLTVGYMSIEVAGNQSLSPDAGNLSVVYDTLLRHSPELLLFIAGMSLANAVYIVFLFVFASALRTRLGKWRWLVAIVLFNGLFIGLDFFKGTGLFGTMFSWGKFTLPSGFQIGPQSTAQAGDGSFVAFTLLGRFDYYGQLLYELLIVSLLFYTSSRLLDRKVEV